MVGGAVALFLQEAMEGSSTPSVQQYQVLLGKQVFEQADVDQTGVLSFPEFESLIRSALTKSSITTTIANTTVGSTGEYTSSSSMAASNTISDQDIRQLWHKFDRLKDGVIHLHEFVGTYRSIDQLVQSLKQQGQQKQQQRGNLGRWFRQTLRSWMQQAWHLEHRIYVVLFLWIALGILWGMQRQEWDVTTVTHFAISALATGGLTAPQRGLWHRNRPFFVGSFASWAFPSLP